MALGTDLFALYHFDDDWTDASGNGNHGTATGATFNNTIKMLGSHSGNFDGDELDVIDIADLVYMVDYQFADPPGSNPPPPCFEEGDIDPIISPNGEIDIGDLVMMVEYQFADPPGSNPPPSACP